jgi:hypothetical protein
MEIKPKQPKATQNQNVALQVAALRDKNPPMMGPTRGPTKLPKKKYPNA